MSDAVLLLAHGAPEHLKEVPEYVRFIRRGRPVPDLVVEEVRRRYHDIGGSSPLLARTRSQASALRRMAGLPIYIGMRNWRPFIRDTLLQVQADGVERLIAVCLTPQYSKMTLGPYAARVREAVDDIHLDIPILWTESFHTHPQVIEAFSERLRPLLPAEMVLFTAHSLPENALTEGDPYDAEAHATASAVARNCALEKWDFAYQSQGLSGGKWLGPTVEARLDAHAARGIKDVVLAPVGFVADHLEILYDVDIHFRAYAQKRGIRLRRPESLNDSPTFIAGLADLVKKRLEKES